MTLASGDLELMMQTSDRYEHNAKNIDAILWNLAS